MPSLGGVAKVVSVVLLSLAGALTVGSGARTGGLAPAPAGADPLTDCTTAAGVLVAVDFSHWGGAVQRGCDTTPTTGYQALQVAGFVTVGDQQDGNAFICRIDDEPPPSEDPCVTTPPGSAYWSYWHADSGQTTWTLSALGATSYQPPPGSVDAWAFGAGKPPTFSPAVARDSVSATVVVPANGAVVSGTTTVGATAANATSVQFWIVGGPYGGFGTLACTAASTIYGWLCTWNTTRVPTGPYYLYALASNSSATAFSTNAVLVDVGGSPTTAVVLPATGATVAGTTTLGASATNATSVQFWLVGGRYSGFGTPVCTAVSTVYGWLCSWNTATVPTGLYDLYSVASNATASAFSGEVVVKVKR
jgi:hypothetical protein